MVAAARARAAALATVAAAVAGSASCSDDAAPPTRLADGTPARAPAVRFEGVSEPVIATTLRRAVARRAGCGPPQRPHRVVERVGAVGTSVTLVVGDQLYACDSTRSGRWCGHAFARRSSRPLDPRLSLTCRDGGGDTVGFAWVAPGLGADFVLVRHEGYAEAYRAAQGAPIRVTASRVSSSTSSAGIDLTEHARDGRVLRAREIDAQVAG
jgi:hypothetical protein